MVCDRWNRWFIEMPDVSKSAGGGSVHLFPLNPKHLTCLKGTYCRSINSNIHLLYYCQRQSLSSLLLVTLTLSFLKKKNYWEICENRSYYFRFTGIKITHYLTVPIMVFAHFLSVSEGFHISIWWYKKNACDAWLSDMEKCVWINCGTVLQLCPDRWPDVMSVNINFMYKSLRHIYLAQMLSDFPGPFHFRCPFLLMTKYEISCLSRKCI